MEVKYWHIFMCTYLYNKKTQETILENTFCDYSVSSIARPVTVLSQFFSLGAYQYQ